VKGYGQFCPLALTSEVVGERWTPLVIREIMLGATRFNDIQRGVPRMSPALLTRRLRTLQAAGILRRETRGSHTEYVLTEAGNALMPVIHGLIEWGMGWLPATLSRDHADPDLIMWDLHKRINLDDVPATRTVAQFEFTDQARAKRLRWIVGDRSGMTLCITDPGLDVDLFVTTDSWTMARVWYGELPLRRALSEQSVILDGPPALCSAFPSWLKLSALAATGGRLPLRMARSA
jgi:DNA-binding HxlR family transcriptional regulator